MQRLQTTVSSVVLGKRKAQDSCESLTLNLTTGSSGNVLIPNEGVSKAIPEHQINNGISPNANCDLETSTNRYRCGFMGCFKTYTKPSRLEEHERSHTGQRPFICDTCGNSYLRETHLNAHARSHLPVSSRPLLCERENCGKRFWTSQHLKAHISWHDGIKPYECIEQDCHESFAKHHQLRAHICAEHAPPGTKPYRCEHGGCSKSFNTNQHLKTHQKIHDSKRYTCVHPACIGSTHGSPPFFSTWSALQSHIRSVHPPTCLHQTCNGRTFANQANLKAHLKLHEQREIDCAIRLDFENGRDDDARVVKKRRGGEYGRDHKCQIVGCDKDFKSARALATHVKVTHQGRRDFVCNFPECHRTYGYKHLLQRHQSKAHRDVEDESNVSQGQLSECGASGSDIAFDIDTITGNAYAMRAEAKIKSAKALPCPFPSFQDLAIFSAPTASQSSPSSCDYIFNRSYDLRRHLKACHDIVVLKDAADEWVKKEKSRLFSDP